MGKYNFGIIGTGMVADKHIQSIRLDGRGEVTWICDLNKELLFKKKEEYQIDNSTTDYREILNDNRVDAVIICTPPFTHASILKEAILAKKHIMIEKPLCINEEEIESIFSVSKEHTDLIILECSCRHSILQPKFRLIKSMIDEGKLGDIYFIHHHAVERQSRCGIEHSTAKWFLDKSKAGGGILIDWGEYDLAFHLGLLDNKPELESINAFTINGLDHVQVDAPVFDVEEHAIAYMQFDNGLRYYYERSSNAHNEQPNETRIYGTKGGIKVSYCSWESDTIEYFYVNDDGRGKAVKEKIKVDYSQHKGDDEELIIHFLNCLDKKDTSCMTLELAAKHANILFKTLYS